MFIPQGIDGMPYRPLQPQGPPAGFNPLQGGLGGFGQTPPQAANGLGQFGGGMGGMNAYVQGGPGYGQAPGGFNPQGQPFQGGGFAPPGHQGVFSALSNGRYNGFNPMRLGAPGGTAGQPFQGGGFAPPGHQGVFSALSNGRYNGFNPMQIQLDSRYGPGGKAGLYAQGPEAVAAWRAANPNPSSVELQRSQGQPFAQPKQPGLFAGHPFMPQGGGQFPAMGGLRDKQWPGGAKY